MNSREFCPKLMHDGQAIVRVDVCDSTFKPNLVLLMLSKGAFHRENLKELCDDGPSQATVQERKAMNSHLYI